MHNNLSSVWDNAVDVLNPTMNRWQGGDAAALVVVRGVVHKRFTKLGVSNMSNNIKNNIFLSKNQNLLPGSPWIVLSVIFRY